MYACMHACMYVMEIFTYIHGGYIPITIRNCRLDEVTIEDSFDCLAWVFTLHCERDYVTMLC